MTTGRIVQFTSKMFEEQVSTLPLEEALQGMVDA